MMNAFHRFVSYLYCLISKTPFGWGQVARAYAILPTTVALFAPVVVGFASCGFAQQAAPEGPPGGYYHVDRRYNVEHGFTQHHSSTAAESYLRGLSSYIQAMGVYQVHNAQANIMNEQAKWLWFENRLKKTRTRRQIREEYRVYQVKLQQIAEERDRVGKEKLREKEATQYRKTYKLSMHQFDHSNGKIAWPTTLRTRPFESHRLLLDRLFARRAEYKLENNMNLLNEIEWVAQKFRSQLRDSRHVMAPTQHLKAQKFLLCLIYEANYPRSIV